MTAAKLQRNSAYNERMKALRHGELDADIFRMMASDLPLKLIASRIHITPYHLKLHVDRVLNAFKAPDDCVKPFPWALRVIR
nr:hypothetical protein [uncultured Cohaesibacter sp.]